MKMNKLAMACGAALMGLSAVAQAEWSTNIGVTSNYVWRGVTQTKDEAAVSGGVDYASDSGFYVGTWASNINWGTPVVDSNGAEVDFYAGFGGEIGGLGYDVGGLYYFYPQHDDSDFFEVYGSLSFSMFTVGAAYTISGQNDGGLYDDGDIYYYGSASFDLPNGFGLGATVGHTSFENDSGSDDYTFYQLDLTKSAGDFGDFTLSLSKTDYDGDDEKIFVSWGKSF